MRRLLSLVAAALLGLALVAQPAAAGESIDSGQFAGSRLDPQPGPNSTGEVIVTGQFRSNVAVTIALSFDVTPSQGGCDVTPPPPSDGRNPRTIAVGFTAPCNGIYTLKVDARTNWGADASLDQPIVVAMPAPTVTGVSATAEGRRVTVAWDDMRPAAPDLSGYIVERSVGGGEFSEVATVGADERAAVDASLPTAGGEAAYRVLATRPAPDGTKVSAAAIPVVTPYDPAPIDPTTGEPIPDAPADGGDPTGGGGGPGGGDGLGGGGPAGGGARPGQVRSPRVGLSGTLFPPLTRPTVGSSRSTTSTTVDDGFGESLPYDRERGSGDPELPDDEMAAMFTDRDVEQGMMVPIATALVLAVWALHLRMLARAARPPG